MGLEIQPYAESLVPAVKAFNGRLRQAGVTWQFPEAPAPRPAADRPPGVWQEYFVAVDATDVRGGYILKYQSLFFHGKGVPGAFCRLPLSEGIIDRRFGLLGVRIVHDALNRRSVLMSTGMGGAERPYAKLLRSLGWGLHPVPFWFRVVRPARFLRGIVYLRQRAVRRIALDLLATTGLGWIGLRAAQGRRRRVPPAAEAIHTEVVSGFGPWADDLWLDCHDRYAMVAERDADVLTALYPEDSPRFLRLRVRLGEATVGWALVLDTAMSGHKQFGDLHVGSLADCLARPEHAHQVVHAATRFLEGRGVDLIVSNQCHRAWCDALRACGFLAGPSNFLLAASKDVVRLLEPFADNVHAVHCNRGDGDGPLHL
jgi:hypothetical protein